MRAGLALVAGWLLAVAVDARSADLLVRNARLVDGTGAAPRPGTSILVRAGRIVAIGADVRAEDVPVLDVGGATVLPGLIDAHVHLAVVPGTAFRGDPPDVLRRLRRAHLRGYLACGVTTILDTAIPFELMDEVRAWIADGLSAPDVLFLGPGITAPGGYGDGHHPAPTTPAEVDRELDRLVDAGAAGVKVFLEPGFGPRAIWPLPSPEVRAALARGAAARGLPLFAHANREPAKTIALDMGVRGILHAGFYAAPPSAAFVDRMARSGTFLVTTFAIMDAELTRFHPERIDDPLVRRVVPALERSTAKDPAAARYVGRMVVGFDAPWLPDLLRDVVARLVLRERDSATHLANAQRAVRTLADAGVPIVVGTDAGNWEILPYQFHAVSTPRELELLGAAGLPPSTVLAAATRTAARMLGREAEIGTVEVGKRANLVVVAVDPLRRLRALRKVRWTIKDGVAKTPREWLRE